MVAAFCIAVGCWSHDAQAQEDGITFGYDVAGNLIASEPGPPQGVPLIVNHPAGVLAAPDSAVGFYVHVRSGSPTEFQWQKDGIEIPGATADTLVIESVSVGDEADYTVVVTNPSGSVTSNAAHLYIDSDRDGMADSLEIQYFGSIVDYDVGSDFPETFFGPDEDLDADGRTNAEELEDGTDPRLHGDNFHLLTTMAEGGLVAVEPGSPSGRYADGTVLVLTAIPGPGRAFHKWTGAVASANNPTSLLLTEDATIRAHFLQAADLHDALDAAPLALVTGGDADWRGVADDSLPDGADASLSGALGDGEETWVETTVTGPGVISCWWRVSSESGEDHNDYLRFEVDGEELWKRSGESGWQQLLHEVGPGSHTVRWSYTKDAEGHAGDDAAYLDQVSFAAGQALTLNSVPEFPLLDVVTGGQDRWSRTDTQPYSYSNRWGFVNMESGEIGRGEQSWFRGRFEGSGLLVLSRQLHELEGDGHTYSRVWSEEFRLNGMPLDEASVVLRGKTREYFLPDGLHDIEMLFRVVKGFTRDYCGMQILPETSLDEALDSSGLAWTTGGTAGPWRGYETSLSADEIDSLWSPGTGSSWLETTIEGPITFGFSWMTTAWRGRPWDTSPTVTPFRLLIDGVEVGDWEGSRPDVWKEESYGLGPGLHVVRFEAVDNGKMRGLVDGTSLTSPLEVQDGIEGEGLAFSTGGANPWLGLLNQDAPDGEDYAFSGAVGNGEESWVESTITGPGTLQYSWKVSSEEDKDFLQLEIDSEVIYAVSGELGWEDVARTLGPGPHTVRWRYVKDVSGSAGSDLGWIDRVRFESEPVPRLAEGIDDPSRDYLSSGGGVWNFRERGASDGEDVTRSTGDGDGNPSWLETVVEGPAVVKCNWRVSSGTNDQELAMKFDGLSIDVISGNTEWEEVVHAVTRTGSHRIRWEFANDPYGVPTYDEGLVDQFSVVTLNPASLEVSLDTQNLVWTTSAGMPWLGWQGEFGSDGVDFVASPDGQPDNSESWIETTVTGPATLRFQWAKSSEGNYKFAMDGAVTRTLSGFGHLNKWRTEEVQIPAGVHDLRWSHVRSGGFIEEGFDQVYLDRVEILVEPSLAEALDNSLPWTVGGDGQWNGFRSLEAWDGVDYASHTSPLDDEEVWMETNVEGPGILSFLWTVSSDYSDYLQCVVDGQMVGRIDTERSWEPFFVPLGAGSHTVRFRYSKDSSGSSGNDRGSVDHVKFEPAISLDEGVDAPGLSWTSGGDGQWIGLNAAHAPDGSDLVAAGWLENHGGQTWLETTVTGPGIIRFWWNLTRAEGAALRLLVNDVEILDYSSLGGWQEVTHEVGPGEHTLRWVFSQYAGTYFSGIDAAWLDRFSFEGIGFTSVDEGLDAGGLVFTAGGDADPEGQVSATRSHDGVDHVLLGGEIYGESSWLETTLNGPGTLRFWWGSEDTDNLRLVIDGEIIAYSDYAYWEGSWEEFAITLPEGTHTVRWENDGSAKARLDSVEFEASADPALHSGFEFPTTRVISRGDALWESQDEVTHGGDDAFFIGLQPEPGRLAISKLETVVDGPGVLSFWWKTDSRLTDGISFRAIGAGDEVVVYESISRFSEWQRVEALIPAGSYLLAWDAGGWEGLEKGYLDQIGFVPAIDLTEALDGADLAWQTGGGTGAGWKGFTSGSAWDGEDFAISGPYLDGVANWLETTVTGPGTLRFRWANEDIGGYRFFVDGEERLLRWHDQPWEEVVQTLGDGEHVIRWECPGPKAYLDRVSFVRESYPELGNAVDWFPESFSSRGPNGWFGQGDIFSKSADAAQAGLVAGSETSHLYGRFNGPGTLSYLAKVDEGRMVLFSNGNVAHVHDSGQDWTAFSTGVGRGEIEVDWQYSNSAGESPESAAWVDDVEFVPWRETDVGRGFDATHVVWNTGGTGEWQGFESTIAVADGDLLMSLEVEVGDESWIETEVEGPGTLEFWWMISTYNDLVRFEVDGVEVADLWNEEDWRRVRQTVGDGNHLFRWVYRRQSNQQSGIGAALLDGYLFTPEAPPDFSDAVEQPDAKITFSGDTEILWEIARVEEAGITHDGDDSLLASNLKGGESTSFTMDVEGPTTLSFWWRCETDVDDTSGFSSPLYFSDSAENSIDSQALSFYGQNPWTQTFVNLGAGSHRLEWRANGSSSYERKVWIDEIEFVRVPLDLGEAVDKMDVAWNTDPVHSWTGYGDIGHDLEDAVESAAVADGESSWIETVIPNGGTLRFWWKVSSEAGSDRLRLFVDGVEQASIDGEVDWTFAEVPVTGNSSHTLRWEYVKDESGSDGQDRAWLDQVALIVGLAEGVDTPNREWRSGGYDWPNVGNSWEGQSMVAHDGYDAVQTGTNSGLSYTWLETTVEGPGTVSCFWKVSSEPIHDVLALLVDGVEKAAISGEVDWQQISTTVGEGAHVIRFRYTKDIQGDSGSDAGWIDQFSFVPEDPAPLVNALDEPSVQWVTGGPAVWSMQDVVTQDGDDAVVGGDLDDGESSFLQTTLRGPGTVSFWWRVSSEANADFLRLENNGSVLETRSGEIDWEEITIDLEPGTNVLRWRYDKNASGATGDDNAWIDNLIFSPLPEIDLIEALDGEGLSWTTGGNAGWSGASSPNHDGMDGAASGLIGDQEESWLETTVSGAGIISFWWKLSSEEGTTSGDRLRFVVDGVEQISISGEVAWQKFSVPLTGAGDHVCRWVYEKDLMDRSGADTAWLDQVSFDPPLSLAESVDAPELTWTTAGDAEWVGTTEESHDGDDSAVSGEISDGDETRLATNVTGPGTLTFYWKVSSESGYDYLRFLINGVEQAKISGSQGWAMKTYRIEENGQVALRWRYTKDGSVSSGQDRGWVDEVVWSPDAPDTALAAWAGGFGLSGDDMLPEANGDGDRSSLLWEYASNLNPTLADAVSVDPGTGTSGLPSIRGLRSDNATRLRVEFLRRRNAPDLIYIVQFANTLSGPPPDGWSDYVGPATVTRIGDDWERVVVEDTETSATQPRRFARVVLAYDSMAIPASLSSWAGGFGLTGSDALPGANGDVDWSTIGFEYASNLNPTLADTRVLTPGTGLAGMPSIRVMDDGGAKRLQVEYLRRRNAPDLDYRVEFASNMTELGPDGWAPYAGVETVFPIDAEWEWVIVQDPESSATQPRRFGRVVIVVQAPSP